MYLGAFIGGLVGSFLARSREMATALLIGCVFAIYQLVLALRTPVSPDQPPAVIFRLLCCWHVIGFGLCLGLSVLGGWVVQVIRRRDSVKSRSA